MAIANEIVFKEEFTMLKKALRGTCIFLPHLSGLATLIRLNLSYHVETTGIFQSGRLVVNPTWFSSLTYKEATFVVAHEIMHLAFRSHDRCIGTEQTLFNIAHDYIINDILVNIFGYDTPPADGLHFHGARHYSVERLVLELKRDQNSGNIIERSAWNGSLGQQTSMAEAFENSGLLDIQNQPAKKQKAKLIKNDVISSNIEKKLFPDEKLSTILDLQKQVRAAAAKSNSLKMIENIFNNESVRGDSPGEKNITVEALKSYYRPPWELALQNWMEFVAPGPRTYFRPSRRGSDRKDVVLPGRKREGWILHIIIDTSGSMIYTIPIVLGAITSFCEHMNVEQVHIIQCDVEVTKDEYIYLDQLKNYTISGLGGSDMSEAMFALGNNPEVEAAIIITDGCIEYPSQPMPYLVLWVQYYPYGDDFNPEYGHIIRLTEDDVKNTSSR